MSSASTKIIQAAAGNAAGEGLYVEDVFSTYLYEGNGTGQTITNGIDLDGEGGLVWIKGRTGTAKYNSLVDSERGNGKLLFTDSTSAEVDYGATGVVLNSNGFSVDSNQQNLNGSGEDMCSWTFRKAPKFFDVVTWTGSNNSATDIGKGIVAHNLGSAPAVVIVKNTTQSSTNWIVYHKDQTTGYYSVLNSTAAQTNSGSISYFSKYIDGVGWQQTNPDADNIYVGYNYQTNGNTDTIVAYLFAHNDGDGEFGEDADQDIIKCGSFTFASGQTTVDIGFEPQWLLAKRTDGTGDWMMFDAMRGFTANSGGGFGRKLLSNSSAAETNSDGLYYKSATSIGLNLPAYGDYIYIAIRRGPMKTPESGTEVFDLHTSSPSVINTGFPVDAILAKYATSNWDFVPRLTEGSLATNTTSAEVDYSAYLSFASNTAFLNSGVAFNSAAANWCFRRAPGYFDVVAYTGDGTTSRTVNHGLGVVPEMMWVKRRGSTGEWKVYHQALNETKEIVLNSSGTVASSDSFNNTAPTETVFSVGQSYLLNASDTYIAYLFATVPGVSKVGSYTGTGSTPNTIDCGFTNGARFVLLKRTNSSGGWYVFDSERGISSSSNDPYLTLNTTDAESSLDILDAHPSGFTIKQPFAEFNGDGDSFIFLAIA